MIRIEDVRPEAVHTYRDKHGFRTIEIDGLSGRLLAIAFEHDIQELSTANQVSAMLDAVVEGWDKNLCFSGNSSTVNMYPDRVTIENDVLENEESFEMSLQQYRVLLDAWAAFLARPGPTRYSRDSST